MAFPNLSDLVASTIEFRSKSFADNVTANNALLTFIEKAGNVSEFDGGSQIYEPFSFAENGNGGSYSGSDLLPTGAQDVLTGANYQISQYAVPVIFTGREEIMNAGSEKVIDLVKSRVAVAESTMENMLNRHLYLDGTGNSGKNLTGLGAAVPLSPTNVYGGIDRSTTIGAVWKNQKWQASVDGSGVATSATIQHQWNSLMPLLIRGTDKPNVIIASQAVWVLYMDSLQAMQRITSVGSGSGGAGFTAVDYMGIPVIQEPTASGISANVAYFINSRFMRWRPSSSRNMTMLADKQSVNQDATVRTLVWAGNLTCSGAKFQGIFSNT